MHARSSRISLRPCLGIEVAQAATRLATDVYRITRRTPESTVCWDADFRRVADSLAAVLARVQGGATHTEFVRAITCAGVMIAELEGYLMIAEQANIVALEDLDLVQPAIGFIKRFCLVGLGAPQAAVVRPGTVS